MERQIRTEQVQIYNILRTNMQFNNPLFTNKTVQKDPIKNTVIIFPIPLQQKQKPITNPYKIQEQNNFLQAEPLKSMDYYKSQSSRLSLQNQSLISKLRKSLEQKRDIAEAILAIQQLSRQEPEDKKKRVRRCANQIQRKFICSVLNCNKSYGTDSSMAQHMRLKHPNVKFDINSLNQGTRAIKEEDKSSHGKDSPFQSENQQ